MTKMRNTGYNNAAVRRTASGRRPYTYNSRQVQEEIIEPEEKEPERLFIRYEEGAKRYAMCKSSFIRMANEANAVYKRGKLCIVNVKIFEEYLETFRV